MRTKKIEENCSIPTTEHFYIEASLVHGRLLRLENKIVYSASPATSIKSLSSHSPTWSPH